MAKRAEAKAHVSMVMSEQQKQHAQFSSALQAKESEADRRAAAVQSDRRGQLTSRAKLENDKARRAEQEFLEKVHSEVEAKRAKVLAKEGRYDNAQRRAEAERAQHVVDTAAKEGFRAFRQSLNRSRLALREDYKHEQQRQAFEETMRAVDERKASMSRSVSDARITNVKNSIRMEQVTEAIELMCRTKHFELPAEMQSVQNDKLNSLLSRYNENQKAHEAQGRPVTSHA